MKKSERLTLIQGLLSSTVESVSNYEAVEEADKSMFAQYNLRTGDSKEAIINRCKLIRAEVLKLMQSFK